MEQPTIESTQSASTPSAPAPASPPAEKMLTQSHVNEIVKAAKYEARNKGIEEGRSQYQQPAAEPSQTPAPNLDMGNLRQVAREEAQSYFNQLVEQHTYDQNMHEGKRMAGDFEGRIKASAEKYPDLWNKVESLGLKNFEPVVIGALGHENTSDIMHELLEENPLKLAGLLTLYDKNPGYAKEQMQNLSNSMKLNNAAQNVQRPQEPLSQIKTSNAGIQDDGNRTVQDWQRWLAKRGRGA